MISRVATKVVARSLTGGVSTFSRSFSRIETLRNVSIVYLFILDPWSTFQPRPCRRPSQHGPKKLATNECFCCYCCIHVGPLCFPMGIHVNCHPMDVAPLNSFYCPILELRLLIYYNPYFVGEREFHK